MAETRRIGIIANPDKPGAGELLLDLVIQLRKGGLTVLLEERTAALVKLPDGVPLDQLSDRIDLLVVLGGDGTILWVLRQMGDRIKPIAAINTGTLGFLTCATAGESGQLVEALVSGSFTLSERLLIAGDLEREGRLEASFVALNEVTLCRAVASRVIHVEAHINDKLANRYTGDGLILSSPTGSTAYSLSAGGPLVQPDANVFVITPICPHSLANRPLVVDASSRILFESPKQRDDLSLLVDGQLVAVLSGNARIHLRRAAFSLTLVSMTDQDFYDVLHQKMGWTGTSISGEG
ncbi:MAG: NAD(+)/NADH kinase [Verrucomicrobiales bacterium]|jgi:NAD+ kinase|nr:NAD(+)/NADH kinase [Verrucomicrobiales bacterium]